MPRIRVILCLLLLLSSVDFVAAQNRSLSYSTYAGSAPKSGTNGPRIEAAAASAAYYCIVLEYPGENYLSVLAQLNIADGAIAYSVPLPQLGGNALPEPQVAAAIDSQGDCYVAGIGIIRPTPGVFQSKVNDEFGNGQFVMKFGPTGSVVYATYLASTVADAPSGLVVDNAGNAYLTGSTNAGDFPTKNAYQPAFGGGNSDAYVAVLNSTATALIYSTYLGGSGADSGAAIAIDAAGDAYVTGTTSSNNFPTTVAPFQKTLSGPNDAFVVKLSPSGTPIYSTYLSGSGGSQGTAIAADSSGNAHVTGEAGSSDFPLVNPFQTNWQNSAFVSEFNATGSALIYSTFWGTYTAWSPVVYPPATMTVDSLGQTYFAGSADLNSGSVPLVSPIESLTGSNIFAGFLSVLNSAGSAAVFSTYTFGGVATNVAVDSAGNIYMAGETDTTLPMVNAQDSVFYYPFLCNFPDFNCIEVSNSQAFVLKISPTPGPALALPSGLVFNPTIVLLPYYGVPVRLANASSSGTINVSSITTTGDFAQTNSCSPPFALGAGASCLMYVTFTPTAGGTRTGTLTITDDQPGSPQIIQLSGEGLPAQDTLIPNPLTFAPQDVGKPSSPQAVTLTNTSGGTILTAPAPLIFTQISISGSDFSGSNNCVSPLSSGTSCETHITFTPTVSGTRTGTLTIVDNATGSPQTVPLSGFGVSANDFVIEPTPGSPTSQTVSAGKAATFSLGVTAGASFSGTVSLACNVSPVVTPAPTCRLSSSSVQLSGGANQSVTMTVSTTAGTTGAISYLGFPGGAIPLAWTLALFASGLFFIRETRSWLATAPLTAVLALTVLVGCGGGNTPSSPSSLPGTPAGTYTVSVTANSMNLSHNTTLTVVVQ
jgi:Beta-propeller repeat/Abnormal spindle-like microcephaly-assoc'd, ASPM-SPD-2-Hydin